MDIDDGKIIESVAYEDLYDILYTDSFEDDSTLIWTIAKRNHVETLIIGEEFLSKVVKYIKLVDAKMSEISELIRDKDNMFEHRSNFAYTLCLWINEFGNFCMNNFNKNYQTSVYFGDKLVQLTSKFSESGVENMDEEDINTILSEVINSFDSFLKTYRDEAIEYIDYLYNEYKRISNGDKKINMEAKIKKFGEERSIIDIDDDSEDELDKNVTMGKRLRKDVDIPNRILDLIAFVNILKIPRKYHTSAEILVSGLQNEIIISESKNFDSVLPNILMEMIYTVKSDITLVVGKKYVQEYIKKESQDTITFPGDGSRFNFIDLIYECESKQNENFSDSTLQKLSQIFLDVFTATCALSMVCCSTDDNNPEMFKCLSLFVKILVKNQVLLDNPNRNMRDGESIKAAIRKKYPYMKLFYDITNTYGTTLYTKIFNEMTDRTKKDPNNKFMHIFTIIKEAKSLKGNNVPQKMLEEFKAISESGLNMVKNTTSDKRNAAILEQLQVFVSDMTINKVTGDIKTRKTANRRRRFGGEIENESDEEIEELTQTLNDATLKSSRRNETTYGLDNDYPDETRGLSDGEDQTYEDRATNHTLSRQEKTMEIVNVYINPYTVEQQERDKIEAFLLPICERPDSYL